MLRLWDVDLLLEDRVKLYSFHWQVAWVRQSSTLPAIQVPETLFCLAFSLHVRLLPVGFLSQRWMQNCQIERMPMAPEPQYKSNKVVLLSVASAIHCIKSSAPSSLTCAKPSYGISNVLPQRVVSKVLTPYKIDLSSPVATSATPSLIVHKTPRMSGRVHNWSQTC